MRTFAQLKPSFWYGTTGRQIRGFGPECQLFALYLISGPGAQALGLYYLALPTAAHETGLTIDQVRGCLAKLKEVKFSMYDDASEVVFVPNMARFQIGDRLSPKDKNVGWVWKEMEKLRGLPFFELLVEMYAERYQVADYFKPGGSARPHRSIESEKRDLEMEKDSETGDRNGHAQGRGVVRGNPSCEEGSSIEAREPGPLGTDAATYEAQRRLVIRRAMGKAASK